MLKEEPSFAQRIARLRGLLEGLASWHPLGSLSTAQSGQPGYCPPSCGIFPLSRRSEYSEISIGVDIRIDRHRLHIGSASPNCYYHSDLGYFSTASTFPTTAT